MQSWMTLISEIKTKNNHQARKMNSTSILEAIQRKKSPSKNQSKIY